MENRKELDPFEKDFEQWLIDKFGTSNLYDILNCLKKEFCLEFMDIEEINIPPSIGLKRQELFSDKVRVEAKAMIKFYNENKGVNF